MFPRSLLALLVPLALLAPEAASDTATYAPAGVVALLADPSSTIVAWLPGEAPADSYRVYGANPGASPVLLTDTAKEEALGTLVVESGGYAQYAVSGVQGGIESPLVFAIEEPCVWVHTQPEPNVEVCKLGALLKIRQP